MLRKVQEFISVTKVPLGDKICNGLGKFFYINDTSYCLNIILFFDTYKLNFLKKERRTQIFSRHLFQYQKYDHPIVKIKLRMM